jgi:ABC-type multidrug transport system ATPase subunit
VLVTTHYMDEAERCHRLAFIFRGTLLADGHARRDRDRAACKGASASCTSTTRRAAAARCTAPEVDEVAHYRHVLRRGRARRRRPGAGGQALLGAAARGSTCTRSARRGATVEDAFVSPWCARTAGAAHEAAMSLLAIARKELRQLAATG